MLCIVIFYVHPKFDVYCCYFQPLLREALDKKRTMNLNEAVETIDKCMKVLYYRDARSLNKVRKVFRQ